MILKNKKALILSSLLILLPIPVGFLLRNQFPAEFMADLGYTVWLPPLCLLAGHWLCILLTAVDPGNKNRNRKPLKKLGVTGNGRGNLMIPQSILNNLQ